MSDNRNSRNPFQTSPSAAQGGEISMVTDSQQGENLPGNGLQTRARASTSTEPQVMSPRADGDEHDDGPSSDSEDDTAVAVTASQLRLLIRAMGASNLRDSGQELKRKELDRITLGKLSSHGTAYEVWRTNTLAAVAAASDNQQLIREYLLEMERPDADLSIVPPSLVQLDAKFKTALLLAMDKYTDLNIRVMTTIGNRAVSITGREIFRLIDFDYNRDTAFLQARKARELQSLDCRTIQDFSNFITKFQSLNASLDHTEDKLSDRLKIEMLCDRLEHLSEVAPLIEAFRANPSTSEELNRRLTQLDQKRRGKRMYQVNARENSRSRPYAFISKHPGESSKNTPCSFCSSHRELNGRAASHTSIRCWFDPKSPSYRPELDVVKNFESNAKGFVAGKLSYVGMKAKPQNKKLQKEKGDKRPSEANSPAIELDFASMSLHDKKAFIASALRDDEAMGLFASALVETDEIKPSAKYAKASF
jgi:hypothetical protein